MSYIEICIYYEIFSLEINLRAQYLIHQSKQTQEIFFSLVIYKILIHVGNHSQNNFSSDDVCLKKQFTFIRQLNFNIIQLRGVLHNSTFSRFFLDEVKCKQTNTCFIKFQNETSANWIVTYYMAQKTENAC